MAIAFKATVEAAAQNKTFATTVTFAVDSTVAVGDLLVITLACDNADPGLPTATCADNSASAGTANAYTVVRREATATTAENTVIAFAFYCLVTRQIATTDTVTVTLSDGASAKALVARTFTGATATLRGAAAVASATTGTAASVANTNPLSGDLVVAMVASESATIPSADADTTNGSWSAALTLGTTGGVSDANVGVSSQYKIVTASGTQTFDSTVTSADWACISLAFQPTAAVVSRRVVLPTRFHLIGR